ncbi:MAG: hypothetical protein AB7J13_03800 [Pyrinomonadaceae bacterium]
MSRRKMALPSNWNGTRGSWLNLILPFAFFLFGCSQLNSLPFVAIDNAGTANEPYSQLTGNLVTTVPYGSTFRIPDKWLDWKPYPNLFLSREEIQDLTKTNGFDSVVGEAKTVASVVSLEYCAGHLGNQQWNAGIAADQVRIYFPATTTDELASRVKNGAINAAIGSFDQASLKIEKPYGSWDKFTIKYLVTGGHTILFREIDFYIRGCGDKSVLFVFMHSVGGIEYVSPILDSFSWPGQCKDNTPTSRN